MGIESVVECTPLPMRLREWVIVQAREVPHAGFSYRRPRRYSSRWCTTAPQRATLTKRREKKENSWNRRRSPCETSRERYYAHSRERECTWFAHPGKSRVKERSFEKLTTRWDGKKLGGIKHFEHMIYRWICRFNRACATKFCAAFNRGILIQREEKRMRTVDL